MCETCGCSAEGEARLIDVGTGKVLPVSPHAVLHRHGGEGDAHDNAHEHGHEHEHPHGAASSAERGRSVALEAAVLAKNDSIAAHNRAWFAGREVLASTS